MEGKDLNNAREQILKNLRQSPLETSQKPILSVYRDASIYRNLDAARQNPLQAFAQKISALKGEFYRVKDEPAAAKTLRELLSSVVTPTSAAARHRHVLLDPIFAADSWLQENVQLIADQKISSPDFADFTAGVTTVDFLVARTGSLVLSTATAGGRRLSVLPPFHIAIATTEQMVASLDEALQLYSERGEPSRSSYATIITGPSRTSDIEKILVLGAHGPKRLAVVMVGE